MSLNLLSNIKIIFRMLELRKKVKNLFKILDYYKIIRFFISKKY